MQSDVLRAQANALRGHIAFKKVSSGRNYEEEKTRLANAEVYYKAFLSNLKSMANQADEEPGDAWCTRAKDEWIELQDAIDDNEVNNMSEEQVQAHKKAKAEIAQNEAVAKAVWEKRLGDEEGSEEEKA